MFVGARAHLCHWHIICEHLHDLYTLNSLSDWKGLKKFIPRDSLNSPLISILFSLINNFGNFRYGKDSIKWWKTLLFSKQSKKSHLNYFLLKGVFAKNERGYRLNAIKKRFWSLLILLISVASIRRKLLKTTNTEERNVHANSESCNIRIRP